MFGNIIPLGEETQHIPYPSCPCGPSPRKFRGQDMLMHWSFDEREVWLAVEKFIGVTCYEHGLFVTGDYRRGTLHEHVPRLPLKFEYEHNKIDPR